MNRLTLFATIIGLGLFLTMGCSAGGGNSVLPATTPLTPIVNNSGQATGGNFMLGYYDIYFDIENGSFEAAANRSADFTLNIVAFLNQMTIPMNGITFDQIVIHNDDPSFIGVDVEFSIYHPFPGFDQYNAYDLRGVVIGNGADVLEYGNLRTSLHGTDLWMKNPDGYTRWFNPTEFTTDLIFGYTPGGFQNLAGGANVNPYKYYGKHLDWDGNLWSYLTEGETFDGVFESGTGRKMELEFPMPPEGIGIMFGYAVVVCWEEQGPTGPYTPYHIPEAVAASVTQTPDVWYDGDTGNSGGNLILDIDLFGWEYQPSTVKIDSSVLDGIAEFDYDTYAAPGGDHYSTWHVDAAATPLTSDEDHDYWVIAEYGGFDYKNGLPDIPSADGPLAAFFRYECQVLGVVPSITVLIPNGGEVWYYDEAYDIEWESNAITGNVDIKYSPDNGSSWTPVAMNTSDDGIESWTPQASDASNGQGLIKITSVSFPAVFDTSDAPFTIEQEPSITVLEPNGGEVWAAISAHDILWDSTGTVGNVDIYYSKDDFGTDINTIVMNTPNSGTYSWDVPDDQSTTVKVKIEEVGGTGIEDESDDYFEIGEPGCNFGSTGFELSTNQLVPTSWAYVGIVASQKDTDQTIFAVSSGSHHNINAYDASNLAAGPIATYDTGDLIYCNNSEALWIDAYSETGVDRIIYNNYGSGSPTAGYQLKTLDWDGTSFSNPQTLPKSGSIWNLCTTVEGDIILRNAQSANTSFYYYDKSNGYNFSLLFTLYLPDIPIGSGGYIREIRYDSVLDAIILLVRDTAISTGGQIFAVDMTGNVIFSDTDVFNSPSGGIDYNPGLSVDLDNPYCHIVAYTGAPTPELGLIVRYSADFDEKVVNTYNSMMYGPARGTFGSNGVLWTNANNGTSRFYGWNPPPDW